jgi:hypothetical protein
VNRCAFDLLQAVPSPSFLRGRTCALKRIPSSHWTLAAEAAFFVKSCALKRALDCVSLATELASLVHFMALNRMR